MPMALPLNVFVSGIVKRCSGMALTWLRYAFVFVIWIFVFPYCTFQIWKFYFGSSVGNITDDQDLFAAVSALGLASTTTTTNMVSSEVMVAKSPEIPLVRAWFHGDLYSTLL